MLEKLLKQAVAHHQAGRLPEGEAVYRELLEQRPDQWDAVYLLGTLLLQSGRFPDSIELLQRVIAHRPGVPDAHNNLGIAFKAVGRWEEAAREFEAALRADPVYQQALYNLGTLMKQRGLLADSEKCFRAALRLDSADVPTRRGLADVLKDRGKWPEAEEHYRALADADPENLDVRVNLGYVLARQERVKEAADVYQAILQQKPDYYQIHNNLSYLLERQGKLDEAAAGARRALELQPGYAEAYNNLGSALRSAHRLDEACECFRKAAGLQPGFALAEFNFGTTRLLQGNYRAGWRGYERREATLESPPRRFAEPRWTGEPIPGRTLLVHADQGFGDTLQFVRFLQPVRERSQARLVLECQPELVALLADSRVADEVVANGGAPAAFDVQVSLASLPGLLEIDLPQLPANVPYIAAAAEMRPELEQLLARCEGKMRVGLVWRGNREQARDVLRSLSAPLLEPLLRVENIAFVSLQIGAGGELEQLTSANRPLDLGRHLRDFRDTAAVIERLDLVITVDTALAHLAGALARPVWTLLCFTPDWRWHLDRCDSPWYPTMRLFRQPVWGDWPAVMQNAAEELQRISIASP